MKITFMSKSLTAEVVTVLLTILMTANVFARY